MSVSAVDYLIAPLGGGHRYRVTVKVSGLCAGRLDFFLPVWIAGSYTRRDFAKHIRDLVVRADDKRLALEQTDLSAWSVAIPATVKTCEIIYDYYAREYSVRGCYLDDRRALFNPGSACVVIAGAERVAHSLAWRTDESRAGWQVSGPDLDKNGRAEFADYETLADSPLMMARSLTVITFEVCATAHEIVICGEDSRLPAAALGKDVATICRQVVRMFGRLPQATRQYRFLLFLTDAVYGGLEHRESTLLMAPRDTLAAVTRMSSAYIRLLGLFSHEYFHLWNIKSMRPTQYAQGYRLQREQPTDMLWLFEGFTAYFDNLLLLRSGVIDAPTYLRLLGADISSYLQRRGRFHQPLAQSSFEAWTKLYNGGEDACNSSSNYYVHGALAAWCMDIYLRVHSRNRQSLGKILRALWEAQQEEPSGVDEKGFLAVTRRHLSKKAGEGFTDLLQRLVHETEMLPLVWTAQQTGLDITFLPPCQSEDSGTEVSGERRASSEPGFRWQERHGRCFVKNLDGESEAAIAGIAVDDEILAVAGERASTENLWRNLCLSTKGRILEMLVLRDGLQYRYEWPLRAAEKNTCLLRFATTASSAAQVRRRQWCNLTMEEQLCKN